jgi:hypothetical protein
LPEDTADDTHLLLVVESPGGDASRELMQVTEARLTREKSGKEVRAQLLRERKKVDTLLRKSQVAEGMERRTWLRPDSLVDLPRIKEISLPLRAQQTLKEYMNLGSQDLSNADRSKTHTHEPASAHGKRKERPVNEDSSLNPQIRIRRRSCDER